MKIKDYKDAQLHYTKDDRGDATGAFNEFVREPSSMDQEPRNMYNQGQLVQPTDDGSRPGYKSDDIEGVELIEDLKNKKDKLGRPFISAYQEKFKLLEDLQNNKYKNPKTKKAFTPKEWLDASHTTRSKYRDPEIFLQKKKEYQKKYMAEKKKDPKYKEEFLTKKKDEYYSAERKKSTFISNNQGKGVLAEQRNRLLLYLSNASKDNPNYKKIIKDGKFLGVTDKSTGVNYYEAGYKGKLGKNSKLITDHPDFKNVNNLAKLADKYKRALPNKAISSYFSAYEKVPKLYELQNFLQADPRYVDKMSSKYFKDNPLHLHHQISMTESPSKKIQLLLQDKNDQAGKKMIEYKKGNITKKKLNTELKKLNTRYYVNNKSIGADKTSPETQLKTAKTQTTKLFNKTLKTNPKLIEDITQKLGILGCPKGLQAASGGRIKFNKGSSCALRGKQKLERIVATGKGTKAELSMAKKILNFGKGALSLKGLVGPQALAAEALLAAGFVGYDVAAGKPLKEAIGKNLNAILGPKWKQDVEAMEFERLKGSGVDIDQLKQLSTAYKQADSLQSLYDRQYSLEQNKDNLDLESFEGVDMQSREDELKQINMTINELNKPGGFNIQGNILETINNPNILRNKDTATDILSTQEANRSILNKLPKFSTAPIFDERYTNKKMDEMKELYPSYTDQEINEIYTSYGRDPKELNYKYTPINFPGDTSSKPVTGRDDVRDFFKIQDQTQKIADAGGVANMAGGGIAGLSGGDPEGAMTKSMNPDSQGLRSLFNNVKKR